MSQHHEACQCEGCDNENRKHYRLAALQVFDGMHGDDPPIPEEVIRQAIRYLGEALLALAEEVEVPA